MSSASVDDHVDPRVDEQTDDRTARARIRDVALRLFGRRGFRATTVRAIAEEAEVSPALVLHHFGSKEGLREAVDEHMLAEIRDGNLAAMTGASTWTRAAYERVLGEQADTLAYLVRALSEDSAVGAHLYERLHADTVEAMEAGVAAGMLVATDDEPARAAAVLNADLGMLLLLPHVRRVLGTDDDAAAIVRLAGPLLDVYTDGIFTDDRFRAAFTAGEERGEEAHP